MANFNLIFKGTDESGTSETELQCFTKKNNEIYISIYTNDDEQDFICLDVSTAIKFAKKVRTEINIAKSRINETN
tara:strand:- start:4772 stop:4996 length:225 start_codon:yes stop_codon:yes gene_type:complete